MTRDANCIFCKIVAGEIPAAIVKQTENALVIRDINPQAPCHLLVMPKEHKTDICHVDDATALGKLFQCATDAAAADGLTNGFRLVVNTGDDAGQTVAHLHIHILGGRSLQWPPG